MSVYIFLKTRYNLIRMEVAKMPHIIIETGPTEAGLKVQVRHRGGADEGERTWTLARNRWGLMVSVEAADCLASVTHQVASQCIFPYLLRERLQESVYGRKAVRIEVDTDVKPVASVRINGRS